MQVTWECGIRSDDKYSIARRALESLPIDKDIKLLSRITAVTLHGSNFFGLRQSHSRTSCVQRGSKQSCFHCALRAKISAINSTRGLCARACIILLT